MRDEADDYLNNVSILPTASMDVSWFGWAGDTDGAVNMKVLTCGDSFGTVGLFKMLRFVSQVNTLHLTLLSHETDIVFFSNC